MVAKASRRVLEVRLLGAFEVRAGNKPIIIASRQAQSLLAFLILNAGTAYRREKLAGQLWPDSSEESARDYLRHAVWRIRKGLLAASAAPYLKSDDLTIAFDASAEYWLDAAVLAKAGGDKGADELMNAVSVYRGELLPGFYDEWAVLEREHARATFDQQIGRLLDLLQNSGRWAEVLEWGEKWIAFGERPEPAYRALMRAHAAKGNMSQVAAAYERCAKTLRDFGVEPSEETRALYEDLKSRAHLPLAPKASISVAKPRRAESRMPAPLTDLIGRERELRDILRLLSTSRLLTLTGSGGVGKTRLALQVALEAPDSFKDGVWFIELAPLSDPAVLASTLASVVGVREEHSRTLMATLLDWLRNKQLLLVLDNCEHMLEACAVFADEVLHASRETRILATSREALGITGESSYRVPSLECPSPAQASQLLSEQLEHFPAVQLFIERATQALSTFNVTSTNVAAITQICHLLDGIPLAIELAAARVKALSVEQIASRLDDRLGLLTGGSRTALPRHQTLRATIEWSHNLLSEAERRLLRRLSVFIGGWTLEAAEQVCAGAGIEPSDVLDLSTHLLEKSLVVWHESVVEPRYRMLETIRQYASDKLREAKEATGTRDRHLRFFLKLANDTQPTLLTVARTEWLPRLELEHDNLRAALEWASESDLETARWMAGILERFWFFADHLSEARSWYSRVLAAGELGAVVQRGHALAVFSSGCVSLGAGYMEESEDQLEKSVALWEELGEPSWLALSWAWLAYLLMQRGDEERACKICAEHEGLFRAQLDRGALAWILASWGSAKAAVRRDDPTAKPLLDEALSRARALQDPIFFVFCFSGLGDWAVLQGDYATARGHFLEALRWRRQLGTRWIIASGLWQVANIMRLQGDYSSAEPIYGEALALARALGDQRTEAHLAQELGAVALNLGEAERATSLLTQSLSSFRKWADPLGICRCLMGLADLRQKQGHAEQAARLLGFVEPWLLSNKIKLAHFDLTNYEHSVAAARKQLGEAAFSAAWEAGSKTTLGREIDDALEGTDV